MASFVIMSTEKDFMTHMMIMICRFKNTYTAGRHHSLRRLNAGQKT